MQSAWSRSTTTRSENTHFKLYKLQSTTLACCSMCWRVPCCRLSVCGCCRVSTSTTETAWTPGCCCITRVPSASAASSVSLAARRDLIGPLWRGTLDSKCLVSSSPPQAASTGTVSGRRPVSDLAASSGRRTGPLEQTRLTA